jgi:hypothetical protein
LWRRERLLSVPGNEPQFFGYQSTDPLALSEEKNAMFGGKTKKSRRLEAIWMASRGG